jgi:hypothetical protein
MTLEGSNPSATNEEIFHSSQPLVGKMHMGSAITFFQASCILRGPGGERIVDVVPGGTELELQLTFWHPSFTFKF